MKTEHTPQGPLETWTVDEVAAAVEQGEIVLIDVRTPQEYSFEHIATALLLPMSFFDARALPGQEAKRVVFHCGSGVRSERVARMALAAGFAPVAHMDGGFGAWKAAGKPYLGTDMASGAPVRVG